MGKARKEAAVQSRKEREQSWSRVLAVCGIDKRALLIHRAEFTVRVLGDQMDGVLMEAQKRVQVWGSSL